MRAPPLDWLGGFGVTLAWGMTVGLAWLCMWWNDLSWAALGAQVIFALACTAFVVINKRNFERYENQHFSQPEEK